MIEPNYLSYKDLSARVILINNIYYRYIFNNYSTEFDHLMNSGLYDELVKNGLLISHQEITEKHYLPEVYKVLLPEQIPFQSYPFEWSYRQWRKAVLAYLSINQIALKYGMILKDATPFNFYLNAGKAVLFDTSSFIFFRENDKWLAYKQFCESFLSPLSLMYYNGATWSKITLSHLHGLPLNFVSKQLPIKSWFNLTILLHIHFHARYSQQFAKDNPVEVKTKGFTFEKIGSMISLIKRTVYLWDKPHIYNFNWASYYETDIESNAYIKSKEKVLKNWLEVIKPASVLDLGANTGKFSFMASSYSEKVISLESDENCVDLIDIQITKKNNKSIFPLIGDLSVPSPPLGLLNKEYLSIFKRANSELVLSLALIHHLFFTKDMSFKFIVELFSNLTTMYLIVEFIPKEDRKVKGLIRGKPFKSDQYSFEAFQSKLLDHFELIESKVLESSTRTLLLFKKKM